MTVVMAKHYIDNLFEETLKGMTEKARAGIYPSYARIGYLNTDGKEGKRIIVPDPANGASDQGIIRTLSDL